MISGMIYWYDSCPLFVIISQSYQKWSLLRLCFKIQLQKQHPGNISYQFQTPTPLVKYSPSPWQWTSNYGGGEAMTPPPPPMENYNQLMCSSWASNDGRMRWRTMAAEEMWRMKKQQQHCNRQAAMVAEGQQHHCCHRRKTTIN